MALEATASTMPFRRTIYVRQLRVEKKDGRAVAAVGRIVRVRGDSAEPALGGIEKNWSPFATSSESVYVHRWLDRRVFPSVHEATHLGDRRNARVFVEVPLPGL